MEETVSLEQIFLILKKKGLFIALVTIIGVALTAGITFFVLTPKYESSAQLIVQTKQTNDVYGNLQNNISGNVLLINTYKDMIKDDIVIDAVQEELKKEYQYNYSNSQLKEMIEIEQAENSQMFRIIVTSTKPRSAAIIVNTTAEIFQEKAEEILAITEVFITSKGNIPTEAVFPNNGLNLIVGTLLSLILGMGLAFLTELFNKTIKDERVIRDVLELPLLGQVSEFNKKDLLYKRKNEQSPEENKILNDLVVPNCKQKRV
ncbi:YveK family protein [Enterococcus dongliensis]|uniref:YveK family protein n=1 Tax=Enterococcus dongliensis TaxID=2559925 RepID=UPI00288FD010|nr:Wzz/FepE/Etk N-terminal domain-containing protein [Enterococcus dongliensis]MDT2672923.1 Wzz/FepE/Etk N-terminal domain-containing protein [Enterococcus dongliensis]